MARKGSERLQTLLKLAAMREQAAARQLAQSNERLLQARHQSGQLQEYERDYQQRYVESGSSQPVSRNFLLNYQGFFRQLETAKIQQHRAIELREGDRERARLRWLEQYMKRRLLNNLREKRLFSEALVVEKKVQRELDDCASHRRFAKPSD